MNGRKVVLDSNIVIYLSKGLLDLEDILEKYDDLYISIITYLEVMGFQFSDKEEMATLKELLENFEMININSEIAENVISIRQKKKIKLPDAIILATAEYLGCDLLTRNTNDFSGAAKDVSIVDPFTEPQTETEEKESEPSTTPEEEKEEEEEEEEEKE